MTTAKSTSPAPSEPSPTHITLSETDRSRLQTFIHSGHASARARTRAQVALKLGAGWSLSAVCRAFDLCRNSRSVHNSSETRNPVVVRLVGMRARWRFGASWSSMGT
jgi:hypothetical protein